MYKPAIMAVVITPLIFAPMASGKMIDCGFASVTDFCATFAVVGTQLTAAIPITGLNFPPVIKYMMYPPIKPPIPERSKAMIPKMSKSKISGSRIRDASQSTPSKSPSKNVEPYRSGPAMKSIMCLRPASLTATPTNNDKKRGAATGNKRHNTIQAITAK